MPFDQLLYVIVVLFLSLGFGFTNKFVTVSKALRLTAIGVVAVLGDIVLSSLLCDSRAIDLILFHDTSCNPILLVYGAGMIFGGLIGAVRAMFEWR